MRRVQAGDELAHERWHLIERHRLDRPEGAVDVTGQRGVRGVDPVDEELQQRLPGDAREHLDALHEGHEPGDVTPGMGRHGTQGEGDGPGVVVAELDEAGLQRIELAVHVVVMSMLGLAQGQTEELVLGRAHGAGRRARQPTGCRVGG